MIDRYSVPSCVGLKPKIVEILLCINVTANDSVEESSWNMIGWCKVLLHVIIKLEFRLEVISKLHW